MTGLFGFTPIDTYATNVLTVPRTRMRWESYDLVCQMSDNSKVLNKSPTVLIYTLKIPKCYQCIYASNICGSFREYIYNMMLKTTYNTRQQKREISTRTADVDIKN